MKKLMCLAIVLAVMAPLAALAQSSPPSTGSDEISRDLLDLPVNPPPSGIRPKPLPLVDEASRALLGIEDPAAAVEGLATVTRTSGGETIITPPTERMRSLFLDSLSANPGPTGAIDPGGFRPPSPAHRPRDRRPYPGRRQQRAPRARCGPAGRRV